MMFGSKLTKQERKLQKQIDRLSKEAYKLSTSDRMASSKKYAEADRLMKELIVLKEGAQSDRSEV